MSERVDSFTQSLISEGYQRLHSPRNLAGRRFVVTYRSTPYYSAEGGQVSPSQAFSNGEWKGVTRIDALDLFEAINMGQETFYLPVGNRDYSVAEFPDQVIAHGNRTRRIRRDTQWPLERNHLYDPFEVMDQVLRIDGFSVMSRKRLTDRIQQRVEDRAFSTRLDHLYPLEDEPWQGHGLGKFMAALGIRLLRETGVTETDYTGLPGSLSDRARRILNSLGYRGEKRQKIEEYNWETIENALEPFVSL